MLTMSEMQGKVESSFQIICKNRKQRKKFFPLQGGKLGRGKITSKNFRSLQCRLPFLATLWLKTRIHISLKNLFWPILGYMYVEKHVLGHGSHRQTPPDVFEQEQSTAEASTLHPFQFAQLLGLVLAAAEFLGPGFVTIMTIMLLPWFAPPMEKKSLYSLPHYKTVTQCTLKHQTSE